jgi:cation diffusion facilitator CzcD-associated flavoprotein CzcO
MNQFFHALFPDAPLQKVTFTATKKLMEERLSNAPELREKLIPTWPVGCRRLTPGDGYLEAISAANAKCNFSPILKITPTGIQTEQEHEEFDIIICATGFNVSFRPFWKMIGQNGVDLNTEWAALPEAYFGICAPDHPNYFVFNGPNSPGMVPILCFKARKANNCSWAWCLVE